MSLRPITPRKALTAAAVGTLLANVLIVLALFTNDPLVLVVCMSVGQGIGTLSFLTYGIVVVHDLWKKRQPNVEAKADS